MVQWLRLHASTAEGTGLIPGQGTKILYSLSCGQKKKKKMNVKGRDLRVTSRLTHVCKSKPRCMPSSSERSLSQELEIMCFSQ